MSARDSFVDGVVGRYQSDSFWYPGLVLPETSFTFGPSEDQLLSEAVLLALGGERLTDCSQHWERISQSQREVARNVGTAILNGPLQKFVSVKWLRLVCSNVYRREQERGPILIGDPPVGQKSRVYLVDTQPDGIALERRTEHSRYPRGYSENKMSLTDILLDDYDELFCVDVDGVRYDTRGMTWDAYRATALDCYAHGVKPPDIRPYYTGFGPNTVTLLTAEEQPSAYRVPVAYSYGGLSGPSTTSSDDFNHKLRFRPAVDITLDEAT